MDSERGLWQSLINAIVSTTIVLPIGVGSIRRRRARWKNWVFPYGRLIAAIVAAVHVGQAAATAGPIYTVSTDVYPGAVVPGEVDSIPVSQTTHVARDTFYGSFTSHGSARAGVGGVGVFTFASSLTKPIIGVSGIVLSSGAASAQTIYDDFWVTYHDPEVRWVDAVLHLHLTAGTPDYFDGVPSIGGITGGHGTVVTGLNGWAMSAYSRMEWNASIANQGEHGFYSQCQQAGDRITVGIGCPDPTGLPVINTANFNSFIAVPSRLPVNQYFTVAIGLRAQSAATNEGFSVSLEESWASVMAFHSLSFVTGQPLFSLPDGFTVNSISANVVNNRFIDPSAPPSQSVPEPSAIFLIGSSVLLAGWKRRRIGRDRSSPIT